MPDVHNRTRYLRGCHCAVCTAANTEYNRARRAAKREEQASGTPTKKAPTKRAPAKKSPPAEVRQIIPNVDSVISAVQKELALGKGAEERPALAAMALACARILDTPSALPQHAAAITKLDGLLTSLAKYGTKEPSKVGTMREELRAIRGGKSA